jgi:hypothetical protein
MDVSRISRADSTKAAGKSGGAKRAGGPDFKSLLSIGENDAAEPVHGASAVGGLQALLLAQESGDAMEGRRRNQQRAQTILEKLEELRMGLLTGTLSEQQLRQLEHLITQQRATVDDPALNALLDDIEIRAAVELAKYGMRA